MACFIAPATTALLTTSIGKKIPDHFHVSWLNQMLWGGSLMLLVEHIAHGEVVWYPPFLTAMQNSTDISIMLQEIATTGVSMTAVVIFAWAVLVVASNTVLKFQCEKNVVPEG